jgi:WD40 repeat protein
MKNIGYSDPPRVCRFTRFVGSLLLLAGLGVIVGWVIPTQDDLAADPDEKDRPFAQVARDGHGSPVWLLAFSPDNNQLASATVSGDVSLMNRKSGLRNVIHRGPMSSAQSLAFSADGRALAVAGFGSIVRFFDASSGEELQPLPAVAENEATRVAFSRDGKHVATCGVSGIVTLWAWNDRRRLGELYSRDGRMNNLIFSSDGSALATSESAGLVKLWDVPAGSERMTFQASQGNAVAMLALSADGALIATASYPEREVRLWNVTDGELRTALPKTALGVRALAFSPDGTLLAIAGEDGTAVLWGVNEARELGSVRANERGLQSIAFSNDGRVLATGGTDGYVRLWDVAQALTGGNDRDLTGGNEGK